LCEQQGKLSLKCSEIEKDGEKTFWVAISYGENCTLLAPLIFSIKKFKMCALFLRYSVQATSHKLYGLDIYIKKTILHCNSKHCMQQSE
jgi:hypothetical protein